MRPEHARDTDDRRETEEPPRFCGCPCGGQLGEYSWTLKSGVVVTLKKCNACGRRHEVRVGP